MLNERLRAARRIAAELHRAEDAVDELLIRIATLAATLPAARRETGMSALVGGDAIEKVAQALVAASDTRRLLTDAHRALSATQKDVGLGAHMFGAGIKPAGAARADEDGCGDPDAAVLPLSRAS